MEENLSTHLYLHFCLLHFHHENNIQCLMSKMLCRVTFILIK